MVSLFEFDIAVKLFLGLIAGALIGLEREIHERPAGLKTNALVSLGATVFALSSVLLGVEGAEMSRIAAGVVTGIGFIGAGAIFRADNKVSGITSAATLWVVASVGMAIGLGYYFLAFFTVALVLVVLYLGEYFEKKQLATK